MQQPNRSYPKQSEYPLWHYQPLRLLNQEMDNPLEVVNAFFSGYTLPQVRRHFKEMLEDAMCNVEVYAINYLTLYDSLEKLIEAAWLLKEQNVPDEKTEEKRLVVPEGNNALPSILSMLVSAIHPERIFLLSCEEGKSIDLLLVVQGNGNKSFSHYGTLIEAACHSIPSVSFSLHESATFWGYIEDGYPFWLSTCRREKQVYDNGMSPFPQPSVGKIEAWKEKVWDIFHSGMAKGCSFLDRAKECLEEENHDLSLFLLHQAAELPLRALIRSLAGHEVKEHSLAILLRHLRRCAPEVGKKWGDSEKEKTLLALLDSAYLKGRYSDNFTAGREDILFLLQKVYDIQEAADEAFMTVVNSLTKRGEENVTT